MVFDKLDKTQLSVFLCITHNNYLVLKRVKLSKREKNNWFTSVVLVTDAALLGGPDRLGFCKSKVFIITCKCYKANVLQTIILKHFLKAKLLYSVNNFEILGIVLFYKLLSDNFDFIVKQFIPSAYLNLQQNLLFLYDSKFIMPWYPITHKFFMFSFHFTCWNTNSFGW